VVLGVFREGRNKKNKGGRGGRHKFDDGSMMLEAVSVQKKIRDTEDGPSDPASGEPRPDWLVATSR
jgi:hypothetical protein